MSRRQLLASMDSAELAAWEAFYRVEEEDRRREDLRIKAARNVKDIRSKRSR